MKYSLSSKVIFPWGDAGGELSGATGNTQLGTDLGADGKLGDAGCITPPGPDLGVDGELGVITGNTPPRTNLGADGALGVSARNTLSGPGLGVDGELGVATGNTPPRTDPGADGKLGDAGRITPSGPDPDAGGELGVTIGNTSPRTNLGADGKLGDAGCITPPGPDLGADGELGVATGNAPPRTNLGADDKLGDTGRITPPGPGLGAGGELGIATDSTLPNLASAPTGNWVLPLATLHQEPTSVPTVRLVFRLETLCQVLASVSRTINFSHPIGTGKTCDSIVYAPMDELEFERLLGLATLFNDNDECPIDFMELQELNELPGKLKSCADVVIDNTPEGAKSWRRPTSMSRKRDDDEPALPAEIPQWQTVYFLLRVPTPTSTMWPNPFPIKEHCTMAEIHRLQIDSLRSGVALTLHTYHAARIWTSRQKSDAKYSTLDPGGFCAYVNRMHRGAALDDPYSDWWLVQIEEKVESCQAALKAVDQCLNDVMAKLSATLDISENLSVTSVRVPLLISNPFGFKAVYLLTNYDELARWILLAQHVGLVGRRDMEVWLDEGASVLRSLLGLVQSYQSTGATRGDFAANNARAKATREIYEKFGEIPQDVPEGTRRSNFAPPITRGCSDDDVDDDTDRVELKDWPECGSSGTNKALCNKVPSVHCSKLPFRRCNTVSH